MTAFSVTRFLHAQTADAPTFSEDGDRVAFLMNTTGVPQVWSVAREGGWPRQVTFGEERVGEVAWCPAGERIAFASDRGGDERQQIYLVDSRGARVQRITAVLKAIHNLGGWSPDGRYLAFWANRDCPADFYVYIYDVETGLVRSVFERTGSNRFGAWSPNGQRIAVVRARANFDHQLYVVSADGENARLLRPAEADGPTVYEHLHWAPDGGQLYAVSNVGCDRRRVVCLDIDSGEMSILASSEEWEIEEMTLSPSGDYLVYVLNADGYSQLWVDDLHTGGSARIEGLPSGVLRQLTYSPVRDEVALTADASRDNPNVWLCDVRKKSARRMTDAPRAGIPRESLVRPHLIRYETFDDREIPAFYYRPARAREETPVVVDIHGGPEGQRRPTFNPVTQYLVHRGFAVFAPNVRGSAGYGRRYMALDDVRKRMDSVRDIRWGVRWLTREGGADPDRIAVMGASYGGFMVLSCITQYPEIWAAAVDLVGIANFITFLENTGPWRRRLREAEYGSLEEDRDFLAQISPIHRADRIRAPLLVIHGANDPRVPMSEAEQIVRRVREQGGSVDCLCFDDEGHGLVRRKNRIKAYYRIAEFLAHHLRLDGVRGE